VKLNYYNIVLVIMKQVVCVNTHLFEFQPSSTPMNIGNHS